MPVWVDERDLGEKLQRVIMEIMEGIGASLNDRKVRALSMFDVGLIIVTVDSDLPEGEAAGEMLASLQRQMQADCDQREEHEKREQLRNARTSATQH